jgi:RNA polymerase sigma factor (sigma-70 family)
MGECWLLGLFMREAKNLVRRFNQGDVESLRGMYDLFRHDLMTLAMALLRESSGAEDAVHEVFVKMLASQHSIRIRGNLRGYLLTAVANTCRDMLSRKGRAVTPREKSEGCCAEGPERAVVLSEAQQHLATALEQLPYEQREVLVLRYFGDLKFKAIARSQGVSINTVQGRYRYGLEKLRSLMKEIT